MEAVVATTTKEVGPAAAAIEEAPVEAIAAATPKEVEAAVAAAIEEVDWRQQQP